MNLSPHFTLEELIRSDTAARLGLINTPNIAETENLKRLAHLLEMVKAAVDMRPVIVTSGLRLKQVNDAVGSKDTSQHITGCAADFYVTGLTPKQVIDICLDRDLPFDQIILEFNSWVHISVPNTPDKPPRRNKLVIDKTGVRLYS